MFGNKEERAARKQRRNVLKAKSALERRKTSHVLHLLLSIITCGIWIPIWVLVAVSQANERRKALNVLADAGVEVTV